MSQNETQRNKLLNHLQTFGEITSWEAIQKYHITRLSKYIEDFRKEGMRIPDEWKTTEDKIRYKVYYFPEQTRLNF